MYNPKSLQKTIRVTKLKLINGRIYNESYGYCQKVDNMVRVVIPKEIRRTMRIREDAPLLKSLEDEMSFCESVLQVSKRVGGTYKRII